MGTESPTRRLLDLLTERGLADYVEQRRTSGKSWRQISLDLRDDFDVDVTHETLRSWFPDLRDMSAASA